MAKTSRNNKINVVVLMGGRTPEYEISLITGREVVRNLDELKYKVLPVVISRNGQEWQQLSSHKLLSLPDPLSLQGTKKDLVKFADRKIYGIRNINKGEVDVVFIAMHGPFGEDGTVQGMLEMAGIQYTGPGVLASALGMDKIMFRKVLRAEKLPIPKYSFVEKGARMQKIEKVLGNPPYFIKPHNQGSSLGASIVRDKKGLDKAVRKAFKYSDYVLVDEYIKGREFACGVLGNKDPFALPVVEIIPRKGEFFDYESKYTESGADEIVPAKIPASLAAKIQNLAIATYKTLNCRGFSRVDFLLKNGKPIILEINTIPGLTPMSLLPKAARSAGLSYSRLLDKIIKYALE